MKNLLLGTAVLACSVATAQLTDGSQAPDFTETDINGVTHTLSDYLNEGKTVFIDFSLTWCKPCWSYHNSKSLEKLYNTYGPNGSDEIMVFLIEADSDTDLDHLNGIGSLNDTRGNWVQDTPYPIIESSALGQQYFASPYPTIYRVCPDGLIYEEGTSNFTELEASIQAKCGQTVTKLDEHAVVREDEVVFCGSNSEKVTDLLTGLKNYGSTPITLAEVALVENGNIIATAKYTGSGLDYSEGTVLEFSDVLLNEANSYYFEVTSINDNPSIAPESGRITPIRKFVENSGYTTSMIGVNLKTKSTARETYMEITKSDGTVVWSEGNEAIKNKYNISGEPCPNDPTNPLENDTQYSWDVELPDADCYDFTIYDFNGNGLYQWGTFGVVNDGKYEILNNNGALMFESSNINFGRKESRSITNSAVSLDEIENLQVNAYPNPASDVLYVEFNQEMNDAEVNVVDFQGRIILTYDAESKMSIPLEELNSGMYILSIDRNGLKSTKKFIVE